MPQTDLFDSLFSEDDDGEYVSPYVVLYTFKADRSGVCKVDETHAFRRGDYVGKLERTDNPFLPVSGVACNRCVRTIQSKKAAEKEIRDL